MKRAQGTIERRPLADGAVSYRISYRVAGKRVRETLSGCKDGKRAEHLLSLRLQEIDEGRWVHPSERYAAGPNGQPSGGAVQFRELVEAFLDDYRPRSGDMQYYQWRARAWLARLGDQPAEMDPGEVRRFAHDRREKDGASVSTVRKDLISLGTLYRWAIENGIIEKSPIPPGLLRQFPKEPSRAGYLTDEQEAQLLAACSDGLRRWVRWALETGMDRSEICALDWSQVDEQLGVIHAPRAKTGEPRIIRVNDELGGILAECRQGRSQAGGGPVLLTDRGRPWTPNAIKMALRKAYKKAGLEVRQPAKILRHTFATRLLMEGTPIRTVAGMMGHSTTHTTEIYGHVVPDAVTDAMAALDRRRARLREAQEGDETRP